MGGFGSGRHGFGGREAVEDYRLLDVQRLKGMGVFDFTARVMDLHWTRAGEKVGSIKVEVGSDALRLFYRSRTRGEDWRDMDYLVRLDRTPCNFGGERLWFRCPARGCGQRVAKLYGGAVFACRLCHGLAYSSQNETRYERAQRRAEKARDRLGWFPGDWGLRPKGMHQTTFHRLVGIIQREEALMEDKMAQLLARLESRHGF